MGKTGTLDFTDVESIENFVDSHDVINRIFTEDVVMKHLKSDLKIIVEAKYIQKQHRGNSNFIDGKAVLVNDLFDFNSKIEVDCKVACGKLYLIKEKIEKENITDETINILDMGYLDLLLPKFDRIGIITFQNGIQNSPDDFANMAQKILEKIPEIPLCIGFYNPTNGVGHGIVHDYLRLSDEWHLNSSSIMIFRQMLVSFFKILSSSEFKSRKIMCVHIAHSEAGLIANQVLTVKNYSLFKEYVGMDNFLKNRVIILSYGAVAPIPDVVHTTINNYSRDDVTFTQYAMKYLDKLPKPRTNEDKELKELAHRAYGHPMWPKSFSQDEIFAQLKSGSDSMFFSQYPYKSTKNGYALTIVESQVPKEKQCPIAGDHAFAEDATERGLVAMGHFVKGKTYQETLLENINDLRTNYYEIHDCR